MSERRTIGFDRELRLEWLDAAAARAAVGATPADARVYLNEHLADALGGEGRSGNRGKTVTVLCRIWVNVPHRCEQIQANAVGLLGVVEPEERVALHWAMAMSAYPFFGEVAAVVGRLLDLQGDVERQAVIRRVVETWGDRPAVSRACRAVWTSMTGWGVLSETDRRGRYRRRTTLRHVSPAVAGLLCEVANGGTDPSRMGPRETVVGPALFPFDVSNTPNARSVKARQVEVSLRASSSRPTIHRH